MMGGALRHAMRHCAIMQRFDRGGVLSRRQLIKIHIFKVWF
jgi:hypothetical protein